MINSKKIKGRMTELGISQRQLAKSADVGLTHLNDVVNGKVSPRLTLVMKLCDILKIETTEEKSEFFLN